MQAKIDKLKRMDERQLETYLRMTDPNNTFMRQLTLGGNEGLRKL